ncbi:GNAT family N-acetyltransferase [Pseudalkalibacillus sp. SCS-8]|uniref:GNAT family N-acetyltransferase n=1 Tax=Pseudalkalibacillus nanhaiensis TaxID=3115291 RepID=UPI0032DBCFFD
MGIRIEKLKTTDAEELYTFELENRAFFEEMVPTRGEDYYKPAFFQERHTSLIEEQEQSSSRFYLIKDQAGSILGRINVVLDESRMNADIGYRIGRAHTGKGIAKQALNLVLQDLIPNDVKHVHAKTTSTNIASQKILEKNGFEYVGMDDKCFEMNGQEMKFVTYTWKNGASVSKEGLI